MAAAGWARGTMVALVVSGAAYSLGGATTTPFTPAADVVTALPIAGLLVLVLACWPLHPARAVPEAVTAPGADEGPAPVAPHPYRAWVGLLGVVVVFELLEYFARGSRGAHPTLSSMADALDRHEGLKALVFFAWLSLGAAIVIAGRADRKPDRADGGRRP